MLTHTTYDTIAPLLPLKTVENIFFKKFLQRFTSSVIDTHILGINEKITPQIDCLKCANCCKKLEPGLEVEEIELLAKLKGEEIISFKQKHIAFDGTAFYLKTKPCMFLKDCSCSIYQNRPAACFGYPHLNQTALKFRKSFWENYSVCPIVFNVIEGLKQELGFVHAL